jgi:ribosomal protein L35
MKQKTRNSISKKVKVTGSGKLKVRSTGNNHYNTRDTGKKVRSKRRDQDVYPAIERNIKKVINA